MTARVRRRCLRPGPRPVSSIRPGATAAPLDPAPHDPHALLDLTPPPGLDPDGLREWQGARIASMVRFLCWRTRGRGPAWEQVQRLSMTWGVELTPEQRRELERARDRVPDADAIGPERRR